VLRCAEVQQRPSARESARDAIQRYKAERESSRRRRQQKVLRAACAPLGVCHEHAAQEMETQESPERAAPASAPAPKVCCPLLLALLHGD
jgi:hypothetical protein